MVKSNVSTLMQQENQNLLSNTNLVGVNVKSTLIQGKN